MTNADLTKAERLLILHALIQFLAQRHVLDEWMDTLLTECNRGYELSVHGSVDEALLQRSAAFLTSPYEAVNLSFTWSSYPQVSWVNIHNEWQQLNEAYLKEIARYRVDESYPMLIEPSSNHNARQYP